MAGVLAIARNVSVPFGAPYKGFGIYNTEYRTVIDLTNKRYFFELTTSPNVIWADLAKFKLAKGAPVRVLNPDITTKYQESSGRLRKRHFKGSTYVLDDNLLGTVIRG